jgi:hypothetical protein
MEEERVKIVEKDSATLAEVLQSQGDAHVCDIKKRFNSTEVVIPTVSVWSNLTQLHGVSSLAIV